MNSHAESVKKYNAKTYDRITIRLPKGKLEKIKQYTQSVNGIVNQLLDDWLKSKQ